MGWRWLGGALLLVGGLITLVFAWAIAVTLVALILITALIVYLVSPKARRTTTIEGESRRVDEPSPLLSDENRPTEAARREESRRAD